ncbi:hypothetical protein H2199_004088 [Coniosporium tulheliwenetii]|uniref:Uncharacterized protein n=1 Tax=Coniosporium tulheliwenetii TaxID=3383036 RepID=A0ACC2Z6V7_9PEZI|nr:hypothetical protein H2199_004088 [Cladosporium sp. JES 115]
MASVGTSPSIGISHRAESGIAPPPRPPTSPGVQQIRKGSVFARIKSLNDLVRPPAALAAQNMPKIANVPRPLQRKNPFIRRGKDASPRPHKFKPIRYAPQDPDIQSPTPQMIITQPTFGIEETLVGDVSDTEDLEDRGGYGKRTAELRACPAGRTADWSKTQTEQHTAESARVPTAEDLSRQREEVPVVPQYMGGVQHQDLTSSHAAESRTSNNTGSELVSSATVRGPALRNVRSMGLAPSGIVGPTRAINFADWRAENPVAASIDQIIDEIITEHRCMLEAVIKNLQDGAPKLDEARRLSRRLAYMSGDDAPCEPKQRPDNTRHSKQTTKPRSSSGQSSVPELLDMIEATASDLGLDLQAQPPEGLHQRADHLARLMSSDHAGAQEDTHAFPLLMTTSCSFSSTPPPCRSDTNLTASPQNLSPSPDVPHTPNPPFYLNSNTHFYEPNISHISHISSPPAQEAPTVLHRSLSTYQKPTSPSAVQPLDSSGAVSPIYPPRPPLSTRQPFPRFEERSLMQAMVQGGLSAGSRLGDATAEGWEAGRAVGLRTPVMEKVRRLEFAKMHT